MSGVRSLVRNLLPTPLRHWLVRQTRWPRIGTIRPEQLRRTEPISRAWGGDRGQPIDRHYIERFLESRAADIAGHVLEFGDDTYTRRFGGDGVTRVDVADVTPENPAATMIVDLGTGAGMPEARFDCIVCTQTVQFIPDMAAAFDALRRALRPGGVLIVTLPGISHTVNDERNPWKDYWRATAPGLGHLLERRFEGGVWQVETFGNVFTAIAFLHGLAVGELTADELEHRDAAYPLIVAGRAVAP